MRLRFDVRIGLSILLLAAVGPAFAQQRDVVLHEIAWMGTTASANDEWIELFNNTSAAIDLTGWTLVAADGTPSIAIPSGTPLIPAGGHYLLERTDDGSVPGVAADHIYTGALGNAGEILELRDGLGVLQDSVNAWYAGNNTTKATMDRVAPLQPGTAASSWSNGPVDGTPTSSGSDGAACDPPLHTVDCQAGPPFQFRSGGGIVINEVMIDPVAVPDSAGEYVELFNSGAAAVDVSGWALRDDNVNAFVLPGGTTIPAGGYLVVAASADAGTNGGFTPDLVWSTFALSNAADQVVLTNAAAVEQDRLDYVSSPFTDTAGGALERVSFRLPTSDPLSWAQASSPLLAGDRGSPGSVNTLQARRYVLSGTLVTMDETLPQAARVFPGKLYVQGNRILDVLADAAPLPVDAAGAVSVATLGLIFPGLMNIHDHIAFNTLPAWELPAPMQDVSDWTSLADYQVHVRYPHEILTDSSYYDYLPEVGKYAEVKALAAGTTAEQGSFPLSSAFTQHLARNVDLENFWADRVRQRALSVLDSTFQTTEAPGLVLDMDAGEVDAWLVHLGEGTGEDALLEFEVLKDVCLLRSETVVVHGTALTASDLDELAAAGAKLVIAPTSNYLYYGATADVPGAVQRGITVSLSSDWSPAGDKNLLSSLKVLSVINDAVWGGALADLELVEMVTTAPAKTLNWCNRVGSLRAGLFADLAVVLGDASTPYGALIEATEEDVVLTIVDGDPLYGRPEFLEELKPEDFEVLQSGCGFEAALDMTAPNVPQGDQLFSDVAALLGAAQLFDFQHMKAHFQDPAVAGMTDAEFQGYLDQNFPLGVVPTPLDPYWVVEDPGYFDVLRNDPQATLDIELLWDSDLDGVLDPCEPALLRGTAPQGLLFHLDNLGTSSVDDVPGALSDGMTYFYLLDERGSAPLSITIEKLPQADTLRIHF